MSLVIWIIDDDLVSLYATRYRIEQADVDAKVLDFDNAEIALQAYLERTQNTRELPDIIFLDLIMPNMDGWRFLEELEKLAAGNKNLDIYILSAFSNSKDRHHAKDHESIRGHFDKPLSRIDMEETLLAFKKDAP